MAEGPAAAEAQPVPSLACATRVRPIPPGPAPLQDSWYRRIRHWSAGSVDDTPADERRKEVL